MEDAYKIISISPKRQITIPQRYYSLFRFGSHAKISALENGILIEPAENISNGEFDVQILQDLIEQGFSGSELIEAFKENQAKIPAAVKAMKATAQKIASGESEYDNPEDIFGED